MRKYDYHGQGIYHASFSRLYNLVNILHTVSKKNEEQNIKYFIIYKYAIKVTIKWSYFDDLIRLTYLNVTVGITAKSIINNKTTPEVGISVYDNSIN